MKLSKSRKLAYAILFALAVAGYPGRALMFPEMPAGDNFKLIWISLGIATLTWEFFCFLNRFLARRFPLDTRPIPRVLIQIILGSCVLFLVRAIGLSIVGKYFPINFDTFFRAAIYLVDFFFAACVNAVFFILEYIEKWKQSIERAERLEREKARVQFDNLKNQLNPHFLFNALSSLNSLIASDPEQASDFLQHMSRVYRYVLRHKDKEVVSLKVEMEFISNYLFLLDTRFGTAFSFRNDVPEEDREKGIVPVTLQILIENAVKHNVISDKKPLHVRLYTEKGYLVLSNEVQAKTTVDGSNKMGLENLKGLYRFLSDRPVYWEIEETVFRIYIPMIEG